MTRTIFWTFLAVTAVVGIGIAIAKSVAADKAQTKALRAQNVRRINPACVSSGHAYKIFDTGWRCATCGNYVSRRDGELYGLAKDGRHERRRNPGDGHACSSESEGTLIG
jgi:hypothetical protein